MSRVEAQRGEYFLCLSGQGCKGWVATGIRLVKAFLHGRGGVERAVRLAISSQGLGGTVRAVGA